MSGLAGTVDPNFDRVTGIVVALDEIEDMQKKELKNLAVTIDMRRVVSRG